MKINYKRYFFYLVRWQLSTPILAPVIAYFKHSPSVFGTKEDWLGSTVANLIGGLIFFWVDMFIFTSKKFGAEWEVRENIKCADCGKIARGYRLVRKGDYDRTDDKQPEFRCEECSKKKTEELRSRGVNI
jgi:DNA-directed RNA polymerase subunit RPC12/RpoP